jgi:GAF domain-containing protein
MTTPESLLRELGALAGALGPAVAPPGTDGLLSALTGTARQAFGAKACSLALLTEDESELVYTTAAGAGADDVTGMRMPATRGIAGWVVASGQPVAISDLRNDARFARDLAENTGYVPTAILAVPVQSELRLLGVLSILDRDVDRPGSEQDLALLAVFADQAAIALEGARAFGDLGRVLLAALAAATEEGSGLASAVTRVSAALSPADAQLATLAALFAELADVGPDERALALEVTAQVLAYARGRSRRPGS